MDARVLSKGFRRELDKGACHPRLREAPLSGNTESAATLEQVQQQTFGLIIGVMGQQQQVVRTQMLRKQGVADLPRPSFQTILGIGASLIVVALSAVMPSLGAPVLVVAAAMATGRRALGCQRRSQDLVQIAGGHAGTQLV